MYRESAKEEDDMRVEMKLTRQELEEVIKQKVCTAILPAYILQAAKEEAAKGHKLADGVNLKMGFVEGVDQTKLGPGDYAYVISYWDKVR